MDWTSIADRFDRLNASLDPELTSYLLNRAEATKLATLKRATILGPRGSGKSALLRALDSNYKPSLVVVRATYQDLDLLARAVAEAPGISAKVDDIKQAAIFFWTIGSLALLVQGLASREEGAVRKGGVELGLEDQDPVEYIADKVKSSILGNLSSWASILGADLPITISKTGKPSSPLRPFSLVRKLLPKVKRCLGKHPIVFHVDDIDGPRSRVVEIGKDAASFAQSLEQVSASPSKARYVLAMNSTIWRQVYTSGENLKSFGSRHLVSPWDHDDLWKVWRLRLDPALKLSDSEITRGIPVASDSTRVLNDQPESWSSNRIYGARCRPRTFLDLWRRVFENAAEAETNKIERIEQAVWDDHVSNERDEAASELALEIEGVGELLELIQNHGCFELTEASLDELIEDAVGRYSNTKAPAWLLLPGKRILELMRDAGLAVKGSGGTWVLNSSLLRPR